MWGLEEIPTARKNGDRVFGVFTLQAGELMRRGTPAVSSLNAKTITPTIASVRVGDSLPVIFDGAGWFVKRDNELVGRLTWTAVSRGRLDPRTGKPQWDLDDGMLTVERVTVNTAGEVVNLAGFVTPSASS
jgi:hypothetical protein